MQKTLMEEIQEKVDTRGPDRILQFSWFDNDLRDLDYTPQMSHLAEIVLLRDDNVTFGCLLAVLGEALNAQKGRFIGARLQGREFASFLPSSTAWEIEHLAKAAELTNDEADRRWPTESTL